MAAKKYSKSGVAQLLNLPLHAQPNVTFNADANMGHRFAILMAHVGTLRPSGSGAG
jgi:hypothetical protein